MASCVNSAPIVSCHAHWKAVLLPDSAKAAVTGSRPP